LEKLYEIGYIEFLTNFHLFLCWTVSEHCGWAAPKHKYVIAIPYGREKQSPEKHRGK